MVPIIVKKARNLLEKMKGVIGKDKMEPLLLQTRFGIHTIGVKFPIDVVILDKNNTIRAVKRSLVPNRFFFWNPLFDTVLELPEGSIVKMKLSLNQKIALQTF